MNYTPKYNALGLEKHLKSNPNSTLNFIDAILLNEINSLIENWKEINSQNINGQVYYNIAYDKLLKQLPHLNLKFNDSISKRLKKGLIKEKLIESYIDRKNNSNVYFRVTDYGYEILNTRKNIREVNGIKSVRLTDENPTNKNINNKYINNKREYTRFNFLNNFFSNEVKEIKENYPLSINDWKECIEDFNNNQKIKDYEVTIYRLKKYVRNWYSNLKQHQKDNNDNIRLANKYLGNAI